MRIDRIETYTADQITIVRVCTDDGAEGIGQTAPYNADITASVLHRQIAPHVLGRSPDELDEVNVRCIDMNHKFPWSYVCRALGGVDTAVWDLRGKVAGRSVCELLGGAPARLAVYGSSMSRQITPSDEAARLAALRAEKGFGAFKIRVGESCGHDADAWPGRTEEIIPAVREALGGDVALMADGNSCYTVERAIEVGRMLEDNGYCHFEEPCPYWELEWTARVAQELAIDVAGGEQDVDLAQWRRMVRMHVVDIVQPDICYVGGLTRALGVARIAQETGMRCVPHSANLSLVTLFTLHMMAAIPNAGPYVEFSIEENWLRELFEPVLSVSEGMVEVPCGPGWGVTVNSEWLARARRQESVL
jgi:L-alanine-DL-glutamate epimerase-like enolase superfamily enzyme